MALNLPPNPTLGDYVDLALDERTDAKTLEYLVGLNQTVLRERVAQNPAIPQSLLVKLASDNNYAVSDAVLENPQLNFKALLEVLKRQSPQLSFQRIRTFEQLCYQAFSSLRIQSQRALARNVNIPDTILVAILQRQRNVANQKDVLFDLLANPKTPAEFLAENADSNHTNIRLLIASNPKTPVEALLQLSKDSHPEVKKMAWVNPSTPLTACAAQLADVLDDLTSEDIEILNEKIEQEFLKMNVDLSDWDGAPLSWKLRVFVDAK